MSEPIKGRGAQRQVHNRFFEHQHEVLDEYLNFCVAEGEQADANKTKYIEVFPKSFAKAMVASGALKCEVWEVKS